jgi:hypothetical protein
MRGLDTDVFVLCEVELGVFFQTVDVFGFGVAAAPERMFSND